MTAAAEEEWLVVGGRGKPRKAVAAAAAAAAAQQQQGTPSGILAAAPPPAAEGNQEAGAAALPGWDPNPQAGGFTYTSSSTTRSSGRKGSRRQQQHGSSPEQQVQRLQQQVADIARELKQEPVYQSLVAAMQQAAAAAAAEDHLQQQQQQQQQQQWDWSRVTQLVVYGLGSVEDSKVSKHQLAMVLLLQELLPGLQQPPQLYDPAFSLLDTQLLQQMGLGVIAVNEEGKRSIGGQQTLFFLPHCEGVLCDNLLAANWSPQALSSLAILGNSFSTYQERWSGPPNMRPKTVCPGRLLQLVEAGAVLELPVPDHRYHVASAFNDMSLHTFKAAAAAAAGCAGLFSESSGGDGGSSPAAGLGTT